MLIQGRRKSFSFDSDKFNKLQEESKKQREQEENKE